MKSVILAGGAGVRLFPLSRKNYPKQFLKIGGDKSLFQKTVERNLLAVKPQDIIIITNKDYQYHIKNQLSELLNNSFAQPLDTLFNIILEPMGRNTAPAIALVSQFALEVLKVNEDEVLFICPSDHVISPNDRFAEYMKEAEKIAKEGHIVTFGIKPTKPETGYGYVEADNYSQLNNSTNKSLNQFYKVKQFHEKPNLVVAQKYLKLNNKYTNTLITNDQRTNYYFWNSGMFAFSVETIVEELKQYAPEIYKKSKLAFDNSPITNNQLQITHEFMSAIPSESIDYAVMEKTKKAVVLPLDITWSDVGSWDAFYEILDKDKNGNAKVGNVVDIDTKNSLILGNKRVVSTIGLEDLMVVETDDVLLIAKKGDGQRVKEIVEKLRDNKESKHLTEIHTTVYRPWGSYTLLEEGDRYKIKRITVKPQESLSLQLHYHRSEHWVVVKGTAKVVLEDENGKLDEFFIKEDESIYVPKTKKHRLSNPGKVPLEIIEVQSGEYVGEDDIVRFDDKYHRN